MHRPTVITGSGAAWRFADALLRSTLVTAMAAFLSGCKPSPTISDNAPLVVQSGRGVINLCEIGMTFPQVRAATGDASIHRIHDSMWPRNQWRHGRVVCIPSLGAYSFLSSNGPLSEIGFKVRPGLVMPGVSIGAPFRGKLGDKLSFSGGPVSKMDLEKQFGVIVRATTNITETLELRQRPEPFRWIGNDGKEVLMYPEVGVAFELESNVVTSFQVFRPAKPPPPQSGLLVSVLPGRGLTNWCEIGMTVPEIRKRMQGATVHGLYDSSLSWKRWTGSRFLVISQLGAIGVIQADDTVSHLEFHLEAYTNAAIPGLTIQVPFRGKLDEKLDFGNGEVRRTEVESAFGPLPRGSSNPDDYAALRKSGEPFWISTGNATEELWYEKQGITFAVRSNKVVSFNIYQPRKQTDQ